MPGLAQAAHLQAQSGIASQLDGRMPEPHVTGDREAGMRLGEPLAIQSVGQQKRLRVMAVQLQRIVEAVQKTDRQIAQAHPLRIHGVLPSH